MAALPTLGIKVLRNGSDVLTKDGASLVVGGTTDLGASRFGEEPPNVERTFSGTSPEDFRILLAHQPKTGSLTKEKFDSSFPAIHTEAIFSLCIRFWPTLMMDW